MAKASRAEVARRIEDIVPLVIDGFFFIQQLRLRLQQSATPAAMVNRIDPDSLNELDRLILKAS